MRFSPRTVAFAALALTPCALLTSCGDDAEGARTTLGTVQTTSYVVEPPVTTTTTTTLAPDVPAGQVDPNEQQYTVQAGDSVYKIARMFGLTPDALANYNSWPEGIAHPLFQGDIVKIPPNSQVPSQTPATQAPSGGSTGGGSTGGGSTQTSAPSGAGCTHTVEAGDNPTRVAKKYNITVDELAAANAGNPAYQNFLIGSQLSIPANGTC
jgi:LysM repeat protein